MARHATDVLDRDEFLELRAKIIEIGASLDRVDRAEGRPATDRVDLLRRGLEELLSAEDGRAERIQHIFSLPYDERWRTTLGVPRRG